jgi:hypothetical protein
MKSFPTRIWPACKSFTGSQCQASAAPAIECAWPERDVRQHLLATGASFLPKGILAQVAQIWSNPDQKLSLDSVRSRNEHRPLPADLSVLAICSLRFGFTVFDHTHAARKIAMCLSVHFLVHVRSVPKLPATGNAFSPSHPQDLQRPPRNSQGCAAIPCSCLPHDTAN